MLKLYKNGPRLLIVISLLIFVVVCVMNRTGIPIRTAYMPRAQAAKKNFMGTPSNTTATLNDSVVDPIAEEQRTELTSLLNTTTLQQHNTQGPVTAAVSSESKPTLPLKEPLSTTAGTVAQDAVSSSLRTSPLPTTIVATTAETTKEKITPQPSSSAPLSQSPAMTPPASSLPHLDNDTVVPLAAYFDARPRKKHKNATVILAHVLKQLDRQVKGCEVDGVQQLTAFASPIGITLWIQSYKPVSHYDLILLCYDMNVRHNSSVNLLIEVSGQLLKVPVKMKGVVMPGRGPEKDEVVVCASGFGNPGNLDQWLLYQQVLGIKLVHLNVDESFVGNANKSVVVRKMLGSGFVKILSWENKLNDSQVYYYFQSFKYQDCILRYQNVFKYMLIIDFDEYFIPLGRGKDVLFYAKKLFLRNVGSVHLKRIEYTKKLKSSSNTNLPADGNITKLYDTSERTFLPDGKSIHLVKAVNEVSVHSVMTNLPPYRHTIGTTDRAHCYIAHLR